MKLRKIDCLGGSLLALSFISGSAFAMSPEVSLSVQAGSRVDSLDWQASSATQSWNSSWGNLGIAHARLGVDIKLDRIHLRGMFGYGVIPGSVPGFNDAWSVDDSNRSGTPTEIVGDTTGDVLDTDVAIGYRFHVRSVEHRHTYLMPTIGYSYHEQNLSDTNGFNNTTGTALSALDRSYNIEWDGLWFGLNLWEIDQSQDFTIAVELAYYLSEFYAAGDLKGDPNEADYQHPVSFEQGIGDTSGVRFSMYGNYALNESLDLVFGFDYQTWEAKDGTHRNRLANGTTEDLVLDSVSWESASMNVGLAYFFY